MRTHYDSPLVCPDPFDGIIQLYELIKSMDKALEPVGPLILSPHAATEKRLRE